MGAYPPDFESMPVPLVRVPWLDLIRGFVAVGRRMSVTLGGQDLCLSQPAMSRQIHILEVRLGVKLFVRGYGSLSFTPEGRQLFDTADGMMWRLQEVVAALTPTVYPIGVAASFASRMAARWEALICRLKQARKAHRQRALERRRSVLDLDAHMLRDIGAPPSMLLAAAAQAAARQRWIKRELSSAQW